MSGKFDWIWALGRDPRMTDGERYVLTMTALRSAHPKTLEFCVRQVTVAENFAVSVRLVKSSWAAGRKYGFITRVKDRKRGTGRHGADTYRLTNPAELGAHCAPTDSELGAQIDRVRCTERTELGARPDAVSRQNVTPTWSLNGLGEGAASPTPVPSAENEEPRRYCTKHNARTEKPCGACAAQGEIFKAWKAAHDERDQRHREARRQARMNCNLCGGYLYLLGADATPVEPAVRCPVCTAEERTA